ncbi:hypothetical protein HN51_007494, partial [Arachis hypogaea]
MELQHNHTQEETETGDAGEKTESYGFQPWRKERRLKAYEKIETTRKRSHSLHCETTYLAPLLDLNYRCLLLLPLLATLVIVIVIVIVQIIELFQKCHVKHVVVKFFGECTLVLSLLVITFVSLVHSQVSLNIEGSKYTIDMVRGGSRSYRLRMNQSKVEAEIHTLRDRGLLMQA